MEEKARYELLKSVYEQHWLHARHVENERLWFTNIFGIIVAGLLAFLSTTDGEALPQFALFVGSFVFILSTLGYFFCLSWRAGFVEHTTLALKMLEVSPLKRYAPYTSEAFGKIKVGWITAHELFLYFYALMASGSLFLILFVRLECSIWWISFILFFILCALWRGLGVFWDGLKALGRGLQLLWEGLKALWGGRFRALWQGLKALWRGALGRGLKGREDEYRKEMGIGKW